MTQHTQLAKSITDTIPSSHATAQCSCNDLWSLAQQFAYMRLCQTKGEHPKPGETAPLLSSYNQRARRIAATYARIYLETEVYGNQNKRGRYYWMALGAFASKTVACTLEHCTMELLNAVPDRLDKEWLNTVRDRLGKGNFWLFMDVVAWHWAYSCSPDAFWICDKSRNTQNYVPHVTAQLAKMPWSEDLPKINYLALTSEIIDGFKLIGLMESALKNPQGQDIQLIQKIQLEHLMAIARHEQYNILQKLIYDDDGFTFWLRAQRGEQWWAFAFPWISPPLQLAFTAACDTSDTEMKSVAPKGTILEDYKSRMNWITSAADMFHGNMITKKEKMTDELSAIAKWVDTGND